MNYPDTLFDAFMYPLEAVSLTQKRRTLMPQASGRVLEIGAGTGTNVGFYDAEIITTLTLTDLTLTDRVVERAGEFQRRAGLTSSAIALREADAMSLPFGDAAFDTVVITLVFCSVPDQATGFAEIRRVLRPGGRLLFIEHVRPHGAVRHLVDRLNPLWHRATGECNINRETASEIHGAGFEVSELVHSGGGFLIHGVARSPSAM